MWVMGEGCGEGAESIEAHPQNFVGIANICFVTRLIVVC